MFGVSNEVRHLVPFTSDGRNRQHAADDGAGRWRAYEVKHVEGAVVAHDLDMDVENAENGNLRSFGPTSPRLQIVLIHEREVVHGKHDVAATVAGLEYGFVQKRKVRIEHGVRKMDISDRFNKIMHDEHVGDVSD